MLVYRISFEEAVERISNMIDSVNITEKDKYALIMAKKSLEKQIPKKANISIKGTTGWNTKCYCPNCHAFISRGKYCDKCGQALDWSDTE